MLESPEATIDGQNTAATKEKNEMKEQATFGICDLPIF